MVIGRDDEASFIGYLYYHLYSPAQNGILCTIPRRFGHPIWDEWDNFKRKHEAQGAANVEAITPH